MQKGSISYREKENRYMGRAYIDGKQKCVYAKTREACQEKLNKLLENINIEDSISNRMTVKTWIIYWFEKYKKPYIKENTFYQNECLLKKILNNKLFCNKQICLIKECDALKILDIFTPSSRRTAKTLLKECFSIAMECGYIRMNPFAIIRDIKVEREEQVKDPFTKEELEKIFNFTKVYNKPLYWFTKFLCYSGMRKGEVLGLCYNDIDFNNKKIKINRQYNNGHFSSLKTKNSQRTIPLFKELSEIIEEIKSSNKYKSDDRIFGFISDKNIQTSFKLVCNKLEIENTRLHNFRHNFASNCKEKNIDMKLAQLWLGHEDISTTLNIYTQISEDYILENVKKLY